MTTVHDREGGVIATIIPSLQQVHYGVKFFTNPEDQLQVASICWTKGKTIPAHRHLPVERRLVGTTEVFVIRLGWMEIDFYDDDETYLKTVGVRMGDVVVISKGGHRIRVLSEDCEFVEVKQGPYAGKERDKVEFTAQ